MKFRQALEHVRQQLELHPERYDFYRDNIPAGKTQRACLLGLAFEGAGLGDCVADAHQVQSMMESSHHRYDFEDHFYHQMDRAEQLVIRDENFDYWRDSPAGALAALTILVGFADYQDLDVEIPTADEVNDEYPDDPEYDDDVDEEDVDEDDEEEDDDVE